MTDTDPYTPSLAEGRVFYVAERLDGPHLDGFPLPTVEQAEAEFDRMIAAHDQAVRDEERRKHVDCDYHEGFEEGVKLGRDEKRERFIRELRDEAYDLYEEASDDAYGAYSWLDAQIRAQGKEQS